jgi:hypothetical protein
MDVTALVTNGSPLYAALSGVQQRFKNVLGLKRFVFTVHNNPKQALRAVFGSTDYPYGWFKATGLTVDRDAANIKTILRRGSGVALATDTSATVMINHYIPVTVPIECEVHLVSVADALVFASQFLIASSADLMDFVIFAGTTRWTVSLKSDGDNVPLPQDVDLDEGSTPGSVTLQFSMTMKTKIGFSREGAKINNDGAVTVDLDIA